MRKWSQNPRMLGLVLSSLGFGLASCGLADSSNSAFSENGLSHANSARYAPLYPMQVPPRGQYVMKAQNNTAPPPGLRGFSSIPQYATPQYYRDYPVDTQSSSHAQTDYREQLIKNQLSYQLDDTVVVQSQPQVSTPIVSSPTNPVSHHRSFADVAPSDNRSDSVAPRQETPYKNSPDNPTTSGSATSPSTVSIGNSLTRAIDQSPRLAIEDLRIQEAEEDLIQAQSQSRLKLSLNSVIGGTQSDTDFRVVDTNASDFRVRRAANLNLSLPLYQGGRLTAQRNVAKVGIETARADYDTVENAVSLETAIAHLNVIRDRRLIEIYSQNVELLKEQKRTVQALVGAGENTITDEALLEARLSTVEARLEQARGDSEASESNYKKLVGHEAPVLLPVNTVALPASLQEIKEIAQNNNPEVRASQRRAEEAYHNIDVAKSFGRPKLDLQGVLRGAEGQSETIRRDTAAELLLNLSVPLLSGGENKSRIRQAAHAQSRAMLESRELLDNLNERIERLWSSIQSARRSIVPNQRQKTASQKAYDAIVMQRDAGLATALDVLTVQQNLFDAEINLVQAQNSEDAARYQLLALMGGI